ncbi:MAG: DedA family protein [Streptosporangiaceae bacterium]
MQHLIVTAVQHYGYLAIFVLMVAESACLPVPSEVVMLFGGALAGGLLAGGGHPPLNVALVGLAGAAGNLVGAWIAYTVGRRGGRPLLDRWGRYLLIRRRELDRAEAFFARRGQASVFISRLLPVVRTFISLPAGVAAMPFGRFSVLTVAGSLPFTLALAYAGAAAASHWQAVASSFRPATVVIAVLVLLGIGWWLASRLRHARTTSPQASYDARHADRETAAGRHSADNPRSTDIR